MYSFASTSLTVQPLFEYALQVREKYQAPFEVTNCISPLPCQKVRKEKSSKTMPDEHIPKKAPPTPKETIARILTLKLKDPEVLISEDVVEAITKYTDIFIRETVLRSIEVHNNGNGRPDNENKELDYTDLEQIVGLLLTDM